MKKIKLLLVVITILLVTAGCTKDENTVNIMAPMGSPAFAQLKMDYDYQENDLYNIENVSGSAPLVAAFTSGSHDVILAPTNLGGKLYNSGIDYKLAAVIVWGNFYIATTSDEDISLSDLDGKEIVSFSQGATPDMVLTYVIDNTTWDTKPTIRYVDSVSTAAAELVTDNSLVVMLAEPVLGNISASIDNVKTIDLQEEWSEITGDVDYPQAGVFVKGTMDKDDVDAYLKELEASIDYLNTKSDEAKVISEELGYSINQTTFANSVANANIKYVSAADAKDDIISYFEVIINYNSALIGGKNVDDDFFY